MREWIPPLGYSSLPLHRNEREPCKFGCTVCRHNIIFRGAQSGGDFGFLLLLPVLCRQAVLPEFAYNSFITMPRKQGQHFSDIFEVVEKDPDGKRFDKGAHSC